MRKHPTAAAALATLTLFAHPSRAQSPWESGTYKNYDPAPQENSSPSVLEGIFQSQQAPPAIPSLPGDAAPASATVLNSAQTPLVESQAPLPTPGASGGKMNASDRSAIQDQSFVNRSLQATQVILQTSQVAADKGSTREMRKLAARLTKLIQPVDDAVEQAAGTANDHADTALDGLSQRDVTALTKTTGDFDIEYVTLQQKMLNTLAYLFDKEARLGKNDELKSLAKRDAAGLYSEAQSLQQYLPPDGKQ